LKAQQAGQDTSQYADAVNRSFAAAEAALLDAIAFQPDEYDTYVSLAQLYNIGGESLDKRYFDDAIAIARKGLQIEPYGTAIRVQLAQALLSQGKIKEAVEILEYCVRIDPTGGQAALLLAKAYHKQGRDAEALALLRAVEAAIPGQLGIAEAIAALEASVTAAP